MMAYLGIPENATSTQIAGALPGVARKLGMSHVLIEPTAFEKQSSPVPADELEQLYNAI